MLCNVLHTAWAVTETVISSNDACAEADFQSSIVWAAHHL